MEEIRIVLLAAPEFSTEVASTLTKELPQILNDKINSEITWTIETITDGFTSVAEEDEELLNGVVKILETKKWDYVISLTDIPLFQKGKVVLARVNHDYKFGLVSLPAFGWFIKGRLSEMVLQVIKDIYFRESYRAKEDQKNQLDNLFTLGNVVESDSSDKETKESKYIFPSKIYGILTILFGMTYDNQPWTIMTSLTRTIAVTFGSGAYAMVFPMIWSLSNEYSYLRLFILMILAIISLVLWIVQGHNLWEEKSTYRDQKYQQLYNATTISTLLLAVGVFYLILIGLFLITAFVLVEPSYYAEQIDAAQLPNLLNYLKLAWAATSVGTITGAVGVGLENEQSVRQATYGYRQRERYYHLEKRQSENTEE